MKPVFSCPDYTVVGFLKAELEEAGISCFIQNENGSTMMAALPLPLFWPILMVIEDEQYEEAMLVVRSFTRARRVTSEWVCPVCGETVPDSFGACWNCSSARPSPSSPTQS
jgi:hypothetical protein